MNILTFLGYTKIIVVGGYEIASIEVFDLGNPANTCEPIADYPIPTHDMALGVMDGLIKSCGGEIDTDECYDYDPRTNSWTEGGMLLTPRRSPRASFIDDVWLVSGDDIVSYDYPQSTEVCNGNGAFEQGPFVPAEMYHHCQLTINSTHVFFQQDNGDLAPGTFLLDWTSKTWTELPSYQGNRILATCGMINNPENGTEVVVNMDGRSDIFNLRDSTWRIGPHLEEPLYQTGSAQLRDTFILVGGKGYGDDSFRPDKIWLFDHLNYGWIQMDQRLLVLRNSPGVVAVPDDFVNCSSA